MTHKIEESELIINNRGAVYHIDLLPEELATNVITVGDPDRVARVSKYFDQIEVKRQHREFVSHTGTLNGTRITVISTGIGPDNIDIVLNELDAVVNIDLKERTIKSELTKLNIIRLGTTGSLQADIPVDSFVAGTHGLGIDNMLNFYNYEPNQEEKELIQSFITQIGLPEKIGTPYIAGASATLLKYFADGYHQGITVTCPGFYGPQGRVLRLGISSPGFIDRLTDFTYGEYRIANFEMESSAIYGLGSLLGHHCLAVNAVIANRVNKTFSSDSEGLVEKLIQKSLEIISTNLK